jgi:hypothetical protein
MDVFYAPPSDGRHCTILETAPANTKAKRLRTTTMRRPGGTLALWVPLWWAGSDRITFVGAQTTGPFVQTVIPCPSDANLTGYVNITDMNYDMMVELEQIRSGRAAQPPYVFLLCPATVFDATPQPLQPRLSGAVFTCGLEGDPAAQCRFTGGADQIRIEAPENVPSEYRLETISFMGLTFTGFNNSAITGTAAAPTTVRLDQCNFEVSSNQCRDHERMSILSVPVY